MALEPCPDCGTPISERSLRCPLCGATTGHGRQVWQWVAAAVVAVAVVALIVYELHQANTTGVLR